MSNFVKFIEDYILYEILVLIWLLFLWKFYLNIRQKHVVEKLVEIPTSVERIMTNDVYQKARKYTLDCLNFTNFQDFYSKILTTGFLLTFSYYHFWQWSIETAKYFSFNHENEILLSGIYMLIINIVYNIIDLPIIVYHTFVLEQKHGFNNETVKFFIKDMLLKFIVSQVIALPLVCAVIWIIKNGGDYCFFYIWIFLIAVTFFMMILYPEVIAPLFDKYTRLPDGNLRTKIEELAASVNFPLTKLFIVEESKRSSHSNAYLYGFHKHKRIVLYDTLVKEYYKPREGETKVKGCETDEVVAVIAHELGHWKYSHTLKGYILAQVSFMLKIPLYAKLLHYQPMYAAFGFMDSQPTFIGLIIIAMYILIPLNALTQFITVIIGRKFEFEADQFAKILGHADALKRSLTKLQTDNLGYPIYDKLYSIWHNNHPPILERLQAIEKED